MLDPTLPAAISAVTSGASARRIAIDTNEGSHDVAPNSDNDGRDCLVKITPTINPVNDIKVNERTPTSKHCLTTSFNSNGGKKASLKKRKINWLTRYKSIKKSASRRLNEGPLLPAGAVELFTVSINGGKGIIYQDMNYVIHTKT
jgi:hypothetical protein